MNDTKNLIWAIGSVIVSVLLVAMFHLGGTARNVFGTIGAGITNLTGLSITGTPGSFDVSGTSTFGANGTAVNRINFGSCTIYAYATTIAASTTATVDCQAGASALTALTGVSSGDVVAVTATTSISSTYEGIKIESANASTTNGYITMTLFNGTGTTFTWTGTASSTIKYIVIH